MKYFDRVKVYVGTAGAGDIEFGTPWAAFLGPADAGAADGDTTPYVLVDGLDFEEGVLTIGGGVTTGSRAIARSKIGGVVGTNPLDLSGNATLFFTVRGEDVGGGDGVMSVVPGSNISVDNTDPQNPVISSSAAPFDALAYNGMQLNGSMDVSQENGTSAVSFASGTVSSYVVDGWKITKTGTSAFTCQQAASVFGDFDNELKLSVSTAQASIGSDQIYLENLIEGSRFARARWGTANAKSVTVGFWVKSSVAGTVPLAIYNAAGDSSASAGITISAANTAQFVTATFSGVTTGTWGKTNGVGASLRIYPASAAGINIAASVSNTFEITGVIFLPGIELPQSARLPFIMRPYLDEERACKRYYLQWTSPGALSSIAIALATSTTQFRACLFYDEVMRAIPTITPSSPSDFDTTGFAISSFASSGSNTRMGVISCNVSGATQGMSVFFRFAGPPANGNIKFDARL